MADHASHHHSHGAIDPVVLTTRQGIQAVRWSALALILTAAIQFAVVVLSGSVALLADTAHNLIDAVTGLPLWLAFALARRKPSLRFTYGYGRAEDLAGMMIVLTIVASAWLIIYESVGHILHLPPVEHLGIVAIASVLGFLGNEAVARYRLKVGYDIGSAALVADGFHARIDGLSSLSVLAAATGVWLGFPTADPVVGLLIAIVILKIGWDSGKSVLMRVLDGVDPEVPEEIVHAARHVPGVKDVSEVRVRWLGHRLLAEVNIGVGPALSVEQGHAIATEVRHQLLHHLRYLSNAIIHIDPLTASGEHHHRIAAHDHDDYPTHSH